MQTCKHACTGAEGSQCLHTHKHLHALSAHRHTEIWISHLTNTSEPRPTPTEPPSPSSKEHSLTFALSPVLSSLPFCISLCVGNSGHMTNAGSWFKYLPQEEGAREDSEAENLFVCRIRQSCYRSQKRKTDEYRQCDCIFIQFSFS